MCAASELNDAADLVPRARDDVAVVIVTYNRPEVVSTTIESVLRQTTQPASIVVVDNSEDDRTRSLVERRFPGIKYERMPDNLGYAAGLAHGIGVVKGVDYVWMLDDDSAPEPKALAMAFSVMEAHSDAGLVGLGQGGRLILGVPQWRTTVTPNEVRGRYGERRCDVVLVDAALLRLQAVKEVGPPRRDLFMMFEDVEFCRRIHGGGFKIYWVSDQLVARSHLGSGQHGSYSPPWRGYYQTRNQLRVALDARSFALLLGWLIRQCVLVYATAAHLDRKKERLRLRLLGAADGLRSKMGRRVQPSV